MHGRRETLRLVVLTGTAASGPLKTGASFIDYASGWSAAFAIAAALFQHRHDGRGQRIDCAMFDAAPKMMCPEQRQGSSDPPPALVVAARIVAGGGFDVG